MQPNSLVNIQATRVTRITIGRLYNLGNYEHVRYELQADVQEGGLPSITLMRLHGILEALKPDRTSGDLDAARKHLDTLREKLDSAIEDQKSFWQARVEEESEKIRRMERRLARRKAALDALNDLGGSSHQIDAKEQWEDDD